MNKALAFFLMLTFFITSAYSNNLYKGFEKKEIAISVKEVYNFKTETYYSVSYAYSNKIEIGAGYGDNSDHDIRYIIDSDLKYHFFPKNKYDFYIGSGITYCKGKHIYFSNTDTLYKNPITYYPEYLGGSFSIGINYCFVRSFSLSLEVKDRLVMGLSDSGYDAINMCRPFLGMKFVF